MRHNATKSRRGNTILEGAFVLGPLLMMVFGIVQIGLVVWSQNTLTFAVNEAVRYASLSGAASDDPASTDDIAAAVRANAIGLTPTEIAVTTTWNPNNRPGSTVNVVATYPVPSLVDYVWPTKFDLRATSQMLIVR